MSLKYKKILKIPGYVVTEKFAKELVDKLFELFPCELSNSLHVTGYYDLGMQKVIILISEISSLFDSGQGPVRELGFEYKVTSSSGSTQVRVDFEKRGEIVISGLSALQDFEFQMERVQKFVTNCDPEYLTIVRHIVFGKGLFGLKSAFVVAAAGLSVAIVYARWFHYYAARFGVDIDAKLLSKTPRAKIVEAALQSDSVNVKLDAILTGELKNFKNVSELIRENELLMGGCVRWLAIVFVCLAITIAIEKLYPRTYFAFGKNIARLDSMKRGREWLFGTVIFGIAVNFLLGLISSL